MSSTTTQINDQIQLDWIDICFGLEMIVWRIYEREREREDEIIGQSPERGQLTMASRHVSQKAMECAVSPTLEWKTA